MEESTLPVDFFEEERCSMGRNQRTTRQGLCKIQVRGSSREMTTKYEKIMKGDGGREIKGEKKKVGGRQVLKGCGRPRASFESTTFFFRGACR